MEIINKIETSESMQIFLNFSFHLKKLSDNLNRFLTRVPRLKRGSVIEKKLYTTSCIQLLHEKKTQPRILISNIWKFCKTKFHMS